MNELLKHKIDEFYSIYAPYDEEHYDYSLYSLEIILADIRGDSDYSKEEYMLLQIINEWSE